ncbi:cysteinyl-tRNA synthetase [Rhizophagus clarus]|uniref:cysteine--tRNA ligase n=1 Tax=Rhizophagus clarus TaxID=94130 RepID=A0A8H3QV44_9GLOM|nr:cysteinyl-tRNA synthetase [Rhizophagus clarus]
MNSDPIALVNQLWHISILYPKWWIISKSQPEWHAPENKLPLPTLKLYNSLTRSKVDFIPKNGKQITWYNCGPTVYDSSHIGHARLYVTIDILRRVLTDYFNYDILFVMNITDIDDKIILRARQNYLFNNFKSETNSLTQELIEQVKAALNDFAQTKLGVANNRSALNLAPSKEDPKYLLYANTLRETVKVVASAECSLEDNDVSQEAAHQLLTGSKDVVSSWLDKEKGHTVTDQKVFRDLAAYWEQDFMKDMELLNVRPCDILTRVSEYVPEIVEYVKRIIENGYGYVVDGSVYFDTQEFDAKKTHNYAKLQPWSAGNEGLIEEGEGSLGSQLLGKKNKSDFALWKKSKPGEPSWESPWGPGRPGWHIECSVMASEILGENMDIHSGGIDLAFPHHDNELAQSEAYHECEQWVNYFVHVGHLHVEGQKMSKSLKNFITIQQALENYTPRQLRLCFLLHQWDSKLDFKESSMSEVKSIESILNNFFINTKALLNEHKHSVYESDGTHRYRNPEREIISLLREKQVAIHTALCDSINTPAAMSELMELINKTNIYLSNGRNNINVYVLENVAKYATKMLRIFGVIGNSALEEIGFRVSEQQKVGNTEDIVLPYLRILSGFRDNIREFARQKKDYSEFLVLSDKLRDVDLVELGVSLDDQEDGKALVKLVDKNELIKVREAKLRAQAEKAARKEEIAKAKEEERRKRLEKGKLAAEDMFKNVKGEDQENAYSAFDEQGIPTLDGQGQELPKNRIKKLKKEWEAQKKLHTEYLAWVANNNESTNTE